jgi:hypothetical protein
MKLKKRWRPTLTEYRSFTNSARYNALAGRLFCAVRLRLLLAQKEKHIFGNFVFLLLY